MSCHANNENNEIIDGGFFNPASPYFPPTPYKGYSIVDGLREIDAESSYDYRKRIAEKNGIESYTGSPQQNFLMLNLLKNGKLLRPE